MLLPPPSRHPPSHYPAIKALFPNSDIVSMETRHWIHVEDPYAFIETVEAFLQEPPEYQS